jgi:hypothetical protein
MPTLLVTHEVDDVDHWLSSTKRAEIFESQGMTVRAFRDAEGSNRVALMIETPDMATFENLLQTEEAAEAMKHDGVRPSTLVTMAEGS